ncbi:DUF2264 domain-containing protein [Pullulanibacillus sp. KACC 23026]|uniref:DUF2264 domain-containing protein n=1 Tax=Pullulanibacillus sp. KACC 23026 TaxID=3028315 RepID=UPI0023B0E0AB|nr:DUF2264 domain-containing protein [Pullulanibacillus sp. KACC 23026]WEG13693.1 DUF2264 domain-containing protein [Pullulanibacillus sp. KACC 23026]
MIKIKRIQSKNHRRYWVNTMLQIVLPVIEALSERRLKEQMPIKGKVDRTDVSHLEAFGRSLAGIAPWLETISEDGEENAMRVRAAECARCAIDAATDPGSPDFMNFSSGFQPIVDAAFFAHALIRSPKELYGKLNNRVKQNVIKALKSTRSRKPGFSNWLLFSAMIETFFYSIGEEWDPMRVDFALKQHEQWYKGDGLYGDGPEFHMDYYNSFVIQPMLVDIIETIGEEYEDWERLREGIINRAIRYATIQERSISPEGTFPVVGRSIAYRFGVFQHLSQMALQHRLMEELDPSQVRCALTAVIQRLVEAPGTFDEKGWLQVGFCGYQPDIGEMYISTGSLYLCSTVFLALGLPESDPFWQGEAAWTSLRAWSGQSFLIDHALRS